MGAFIKRRCARRTPHLTKLGQLYWRGYAGAALRTYFVLEMTFQNLLADPVERTKDTGAELAYFNFSFAITYGFPRSLPWVLVIAVEANYGMLEN